MLKELTNGVQVYMVTGYTDLRRSIDGLAMIVQAQLKLDPFNKALFLFCGRRCDRIKGLLWEGDGFLLLYKRLDNGRFQWPRCIYRTDCHNCTGFLPHLAADCPWKMPGKKSLPEMESNRLLSDITLTVWSNS